MYLSRLNGTKLRRSPSEVGQLQLLADAEKLKEERDELKKECEKAKEESKALALEVEKLRDQLASKQNQAQDDEDDDSGMNCINDGNGSMAHLV